MGVIEKINMGVNFRSMYCKFRFYLFLKSSNRGCCIWNFWRQINPTLYLSNFAHFLHKPLHIIGILL